MRVLTDGVKRFYHATGFDIEKLYNTMMNTIDESIERRERLSKRVKNMLKAKRILFIVWFFYNLFIFYTVVNKGYSIEGFKIVEYSIDMVRVLFIVAKMMIMLMYLYISCARFDRMILKRDEGLENYLRNVQPRLKNPCEKCSVTKCIRSFHCEICEKCILRYEFHSKWFNRCIGSQNIYIYSIFLKAMMIYFLTFLANILLTIVLIPGVAFPIVLFAATLYLFIKFCLFSRKLFININKNMTSTERLIWRKLPYLWRSDNKEFFNPFDKGLTRNREEIFISYWYTTLEVPKAENSDTSKDEIKTEANLPEVSVLDQSNNQITNEDSSLSIRALNKNDKFKIGKGYITI
jgi:hypothetical protein